jgi:hypothetical protein
MYLHEEGVMYQWWGPGVVATPLHITKTRKQEIKTCPGLVQMGPMNEGLLEEEEVYSDDELFDRNLSLPSEVRTLS